MIYGQMLPRLGVNETLCGRCYANAFKTDFRMARLALA